MVTAAPARPPADGLRAARVLPRLPRPDSPFGAAAFWSWLVLFATVVSLACCQPRHSSPSAAMPAYQTDKFRLSAGPCAVDGYPATILEGRFLNALGGGFPVPYGHTLDGNWGRSGIGWAVGEEQQAVPDSLELRWFSYTEDKFYEGHFLLPQQRLHALLQQGYWNAEEKKHETYQSFTVCVAPTGAAYVWLAGTNTVFVGRYQAREIQFDFKEFIPMADRAQVVKEGRESLPPQVKREIAAGTVGTKQWDAYLKTYPWRVAFSQPLVLTDFAVGYRNAEEMAAPLTANLAPYLQHVLAPSSKPVPKDAVFYLSGAYGRKALFRVSLFDEAETMAAFRVLHAQHPTEPLTLFIDTDERLGKVALSLRAGGQVIPLAKSPVQIVPLP